MRRLDDKGRKRLAMAMERYRPAQLGDLNKTADELRNVCIALGWDWQYSRDDAGRPVGYLPWAKAQLERRT